MKPQDLSTGESATTSRRLLDTLSHGGPHADRIKAFVDSLDAWKPTCQGVLQLLALSPDTVLSIVLKDPEDAQRLAGDLAYLADGYETLVRLLNSSRDRLVAALSVVAGGDA